MRYIFILLTFFFLTSCEIDQNRSTNTMDQAAFDLKVQKMAKEGKHPSIGQQILEARNNKGISEDELAKAVGLSKGNIISIENNKVVPTRDVITDLQKVLEAEIILDATRK